jgi:hypothetical protein
MARIQTPATFDCRNEPSPRLFIETFSEINVVVSVAIGWQRLNIIETQNTKVSVCPPHGAKARHLVIHLYCHVELSGNVFSYFSRNREDK